MIQDRYEVVRSSTPEDFQLVPPLQRLHGRLGVLLGDTDEVAYGHLVERYHLRTLDDLEAEVQDQDEWDVEVGREELLGVPEAMDEDRVALREDDDGEGDEASPCGVWLEGCRPRKFAAVDALTLAAVVEAQVDHADDDPETS